MKRIDAAIAIVCRDQKILIWQRKDDDTLGGYWEFRGGTQEDGGPRNCLARELREELAIAPAPSPGTVEHDCRDVQILLHSFLCAYESGEVEHLEYRTPPRLRRRVELTSSAP